MPARRFLRTSLLGLALLSLSLLVIRCWPRPPLSDSVFTSTAYYSSDGQLLRLTLAADQQYRLWTPLEQMSPQLIRAVLRYEDRYFYWHPGINPKALARALLSLRDTRRLGGSTLSMQLARLYYGIDSKTLSGKLEQIARALQLEACYSKNAILEAYLNLAPYGGNIQGVGAASHIYFHQTPERLSLGQAASLAVIPQNPNQRGRGIGLETAKLRLLERLTPDLNLSPEQWALARLPSPLHSSTALPYRAPHFVDRLEQLRRNTGQAPGGNQHTSLDNRLQQLLERHIQQYVQRHGSLGLNNASALLVDSRSLQVKAWVGSADYFNTRIQGQVNGVIAKRSPGSTLKPFIYALGLDQGLLHPASLLKDAPTDFGPYTPENFDGQFRGPISAQDALIHSRNIPAVWVASQLRSPNLYELLQMAGANLTRSQDHYGLALVLGGGELSLETLAGLYASLARQGQWQPLNYFAHQTPNPGPHLFSPEASFITLHMLQQNPRPDTDLSHAPTRPWPVAWKTGTSWGFRDAWTLGVFGHYVLGVWVGNFDSRSNPALVGVDAAAPLFFALQDAISLQDPNPPPSPSIPPGVKTQDICLASGELPNAWCPQTQKTWYIPGKSPMRVSQLHRPVAIDLRSQQPVCPPYNPHNVRLEIMEFWSSDMQKLFRQAGLPRRTPPHCQHTSSEPPEITSPLRHVSYQLQRHKPDASIPLQARAGADVKTLYWFDGNRFLGQTDPHSALPYRPTDPGEHRLQVVDDWGQAAERHVWIEWIDH